MVNGSLSMDRNDHEKLQISNSLYKRVAYVTKSEILPIELQLENDYNTNQKIRNESCITQRSETKWQKL